MTKYILLLLKLLLHKFDVFEFIILSINLLLLKLIYIKNKLANNSIDIK
jgi:hypothetical protein